MKPALGRVVRHDPRSLNYPAATAAMVKSVRHKRHVRIYDQNCLPFLPKPYSEGLGACTGMAMAGALSTGNLNDPKRRLYERAAVGLYARATELDPFDGEYPPQDTGSSGLGVAQAAKEAGFISGYTHAFGLEHALGALALNPVIIGTNWYESMFDVEQDGSVELKGSIAGGHEYCLVGLNVKTKTVTAANSWGTSWGKQGYFTLSFDQLQRLLDEDGDVTAVQA